MTARPRSRPRFHWPLLIIMVLTGLYMVWTLQRGQLFEHHPADVLVTLGFALIAIIAATDAILKLWHTAVELVWDRATAVSHLQARKSVTEAPAFPPGWNMPSLRSLYLVLLMVLLVIAAASNYALMPDDMQGLLFGNMGDVATTMGRFLQQLAIGAIDAFLFFFDEGGRSALIADLGLRELRPRGFAADLVGSGFKIYGFVLLAMLLRAIAVPAVLATRRWRRSL